MLSFWLHLVATLMSVTVQGKLCYHPDLQTEYPPPIFHQVLSGSFLDSFEEILVIGDVHGCFDELRTLLDKSHSSGDNVLKLLTGDFTRKGPKSSEVLDFVRTSPSVLSVRGNNDQVVMLGHFNDSYYAQLGEDIPEVSEEQFEFMEQLPYTISLPSLKAIIVHAGLRLGIPLEDNWPYDLMNVRNMVADDNCEGGYRPHNGYGKGVPWASVWSGPLHVYFGHDQLRNLQETPHATGLDTGCVYGKWLTGVFIKGPRIGHIVTQNATRAYFAQRPRTADSE